MNKELSPTLRTPKLLASFLRSAGRYARSSSRHLCFPTLRPLAAIYWPHVLAPEFVGVRARLEELTNTTEGLRVEVERLLGPLLVSEASSMATALVRQFLARLRTDYADTADRTDAGPVQLHATEVTLPHEDRLSDLGNYTFFRSIAPNVKACERVFAYPPHLDEVMKYQDEIPIPRQFLYGALQALFYEGPLDPERTGLTFTNDGFVFINWPRLFETNWWPTVRLSARDNRSRQLKRSKGAYVPAVHRVAQDADSPYYPDNMAETVLREANRTPCRFRSALVVPDLALAHRHMPAHMASKANTASQFIRIADQTGCFNWHENHVDPCTIIDTLKLARVPGLFDGTIYLRALHRASHSRRQAARTLDGTTHVARPGAKVYTFPFRPWDYIAKLRESHPEPERIPKTLWFGPKDTEKLYAVRKKDGFYFTRPGLLTQRLEKEAPGEVEVWCRALDSLKILERVHHKDAFDFKEQRKGWKSRFYQNLKVDLITSVAASVIKDFTSLDDLTHKEKQQVMMRLRHKFSQETGEGGGRWHYRLCADAAKQITDPHMVRRVLNVVLPHQTSLDPAPAHFYTPFAVNIFERFAKISLGLLDPALITQDGPMNRIYDVQEPAYYIYAWSQFCREHYAGSLPTKQTLPGDSDRWTPQEDMLLLMHYRRPRMRNGDWTDVLSKLYNIRGRDITRATASRRIRTCNKLLEQAMHPTTFGHFSFGGCYGPGMVEARTRAKRTVLVLGYLFYHQRVLGKVYQKLPNVSGILNRPNEDILALDLPQAYSDPLFREFR